MYRKVKLFITLSAGMYIITSCNNGTTTDTSKTDTATTSSAQSDTANSKRSMSDTMKMDNGLMTSMTTMMDKMSSMKMSGDFDLDFANMMIIHHQGAIDMSNEELKSGTDEKMKKMAEKIITKQKEEIGKLQSIIQSYKPMKMEMGKHDELSEMTEEMKTKMSDMKMTGNMDKDFAMMMISHHEDAIKMSKDELSHGMNAPLKEMAKKGIDDQTKEITDFKTWLSANK